jgi:TPR repeat protein
MRQTLGEIEVGALVRENRQLIRQGNYAAAVERNEAVLAKAGNMPPGDAALYNLGLIYADPENKLGDINKSYDFFARLEEQFPSSRFVEEARTWGGLLEMMRECKQRQLSALQQKNIEPVAVSPAPVAVSPPPVAVSPPLNEKRELVDARGFEAAVAENLKLFANNREKLGDDQAFYRLGLLYAHYENPKKDYKMAMHFMKGLVAEYPDSPLVEEARIWIGVFDVIEKLQQVDVEVDEKKKEFIQ